MNKTQLTIKASLISGALFVLYGCNGDETVTIPTIDPHIDHIQVTALNPPLGEFDAGDQVAAGYPLQYQATAYYDNGQPAEDVTDSVTWYVDDTSIASIDIHGEVNGVSEGITHIQASWKEVSSNAASLTVTDEVATELKISGRSATLNGVPVPFEAYAKFSDGTKQNLTQFVEWHSSDISVGEFSSNTNANSLIPKMSGYTEISASYAPTTLASNDSFSEYVMYASDIDPDNPVSLSLTPTVKTLVQGTSEKYQVMMKINTIESAPQISPFDVTAYLEFESSDSTRVELEKSTDAEGKAVVRAKALLPTDGITITASGDINETTYTRAATLAVSEAMISDMSIDCGDANMPAGLDLACTATATFDPEPDEDIVINHDITESVSWSTEDPSIMTASTTTYGLFTGVSPATTNVIAAIAQFNKNNSASVVFAKKANVTVTDAIINAISITNTETSINSGETISMKAVAETSLGDENVTSRVVWEVNDETAATIDSSGQLTGLRYFEEAGASVDISASIDDLYSPSYTLAVQEPTIPMCGTGVNDSDLTNATRKCLKVATDDEGHWFTSSPSINVMNTLSYSADDDDDNQGDTYARTYTEDGEYGPYNGQFATFRWDGYYSNQASRWCDKLSSLNFAGKNNWRTPEPEEIEAFYTQYQTYGAGVWSALGWPARNPYWAMHHIYNYRISLADGAIYNNEYTYGNIPEYATCIAN